MLRRRPQGLCPWTPAKGLCPLETRQGAMRPLHPSGGDAVPSTPARGFAPSTPHWRMDRTPQKKGSRRMRMRRDAGEVTFCFGKAYLQEWGLRRGAGGDRKAPGSRLQARNPCFPRRLSAAFDARKRPPRRHPILPEESTQLHTPTSIRTAGCSLVCRRITYKKGGLPLPGFTCTDPLPCRCLR